MATNFEFYKDTILEIIGNRMEIATVNNRPVPCEETNCDACGFRNGCGECDIVQWLYAEHVEHPKLTKRERAFCEAVQTGWIARDCDVVLCYFDSKPNLQTGVWSSEGGCYVNLEVFGLQHSFMFISDLAANPWSVEDLLKLEVEEHGN